LNLESDELKRTIEMDIQEVPFNRSLGIQPSSKDGYILEMGYDKKLSNHLGTLHAGALFTLAEAASGEFLLRQFLHTALEIIPVVRKVEIKYSRPVESTVYARADFAERSADAVLRALKEKRKAMAEVKVMLYNEAHERTAVSKVVWFLALVQ
jgi:acyl-coenzyme A thioesterase PaaI-like protein